MAYLKNYLLEISPFLVFSLYIIRCYKRDVKSLLKSLDNLVIINERQRQEINHLRHHQADPADYWKNEDSSDMQDY